MKRHKLLLITTLAIFVIVDTSYYWDGMLGIWAMPVMITLLIAVLVLVIALGIQICLAIKEKMRLRSRLYLIGIMVSAILISVYLPDPESLGPKDVLIAQHTGSANCSIVLKLKQGDQFQEQSVCFGIEKTTGTYSIQNDTIRLIKKNPRTGDNYEFAVIRKATYSNKKYPASYIYTKE